MSSKIGQGKALRGQTKEVILNVYSYLKTIHETSNSVVPVMDQLAGATQLSTHTVGRVIRDQRIKGKQIAISSPKRRNRKNKCENSLNKTSQIPISNHEDSIIVNTDFDEPESSPLSLLSSRASSASPLYMGKKYEIDRSLDKQNELLALACKYLEASQEPENYISAVSKVWGEKLEALSPDQRLFAEKAINDILFEASLGTLSKYSVKINQDPYHQHMGM